MNTPRSILIIRLSSLGDILHTIPAYQGLRASLPGSNIDWLVDERMQFLVSAVPCINEVISFDGASLREAPMTPRTWRSFAAVVRKMRAKEYDLCLDFQGLLKTAVLSLLSGARTRLGFSKDLVREVPAHSFYHRTVGGSDGAGHIVALNRRLAAAAGAHIFPENCPLTIPESDIRQVENLLLERRLHDFVVINPGGGWSTKTWQTHRYASLANKIHHELGMPVVVTTGPEEHNLYDEIAAGCGDFRPYHFSLSFLQLVPLLRRCRLFVGGDTGPFHLACMVGTPVVGIYGPTSPVRNGPWRNDDEAVVHELPCSFCYGRTCPTKNECMDISLEEVFKAILKRLERAN